MEEARDKFNKHFEENIGQEIFGQKDIPPSECILIPFYPKRIVDNILENIWEFGSSLHIQIKRGLYSIWKGI